jgi:acyl-coenzyme A thioesterase PaaI-like protein
MFKKAWQMKLLLNIWPPFLFTGIRVLEVSDDFRKAKVRLKLSMFNKNAVGVHFGGSLYAMTDPFCMLLVMSRLGKDYVVWDKSADIDYIKPGKGTVTAEFIITDAFIEDILSHTAQGEKYLPEIPVYVKDAQGELVAKLNRTLYIRRKKTAQ